uniref:non-specific serine/threonine protein kinase n=1 Tax=Sedum alfredii TaxID=439688 RepID=A0A410N667_9MAGN|nr:LRR receptor-like kinase family protein [Sedum alfredii]
MPVHSCSAGGFTFFLIFFFTVIINCTFLVLAVNLQGEALLSWRSTLNSGESIQVLENWNNQDGTPCKWFGITCNQNNEVVELELKDVDLLGAVPENFTSLLSLNKLVLSGTNLTGSITKEIGILTELLHLDLSDNALSGVIPDELCSLSKLQELYLNSNGLVGTIPKELGKLTSLKWLVLYDNQLSGEIPTSIGNLKNLEVIRAGGNKNLDGPLPQEIGNCTNLVMLGLAETSLSGSLPQTIGMLKNLETLAIYTALLSGPIPTEIGECTKLKNIYLYENSLSGSIPSSLGKLKNLQNLLLWQNNLVGVIPPEIGNCNLLQVVDFSMNSITGSIPTSVGNLTMLQELQLSVNQLSGEIPTQIGNCKSLTHIELDNNQITGAIPEDMGLLGNLSLLFLWQNKLEGNIPSSLSNCQNLEAMDLSGNSLNGAIPKGIFQLPELKKLLLISNNLSGVIPPEIGMCSSLIRFRASNNKITGAIPPQIGNLSNLNFFDLGVNRISGIIPAEISGCRNLTFIDLHSNSISGVLPENLDQLVSLQFIDISDNMIEGELSSSIGSLTSLTKLILSKNKFSGAIPSNIGSCSKLQLLDLSNNVFSSNIPPSIGSIPSLEILLNLSCNMLTGHIPQEFTALDKLGVLDLSHNFLSGDLHYLADLQNLITLNVSNNNFSGRVPNTPFFQKLPLNVLSSNPSLCFPNTGCSSNDTNTNRRAAARIAMVVLLSAACVLLLAALYIIVAGRRKQIKKFAECSSASADEDITLTPPWEVMLYQKLDLSINDVTKTLTPSNIIGHGRTGVVYKSTLSSNTTIAVKRFRSSEKTSAAAFSSEIATLARIRHRNIVRVLGYATNHKTKLLFYDYMPNGTLGDLLHNVNNAVLIEWDTRLNIAVGVAEGMAYLHHGCVPAILHRDVKAHNILLGDRFEPCLADFGLARFVEDDGDCRSFSVNPQLAGSFGYMAPEYASMIRISEKSDVYSFGVVLLEIITGKRPADPSFAEGQHLIQWVREHLKSKKDPIEVLDQVLQGHPDTQIQEMLQALGISLLCTSNRAEDRPTMKDVAVLLREIRHERVSEGELQKPARSQNGGGDGSEGMAISSSSVGAARMLMQQGSSQHSLSSYSPNSSIGYQPSELQ